jgi:hypothetical protein
VLASVFIGAALFACRDFVGATGGGLIWSRRVPIAIVVASVLGVRAMRRAVIVSPFGLEARRTFISWRVPWSAVETFGERGPAGGFSHERSLTVVLLDGSTRSAHVGLPRRGQPPFVEVATAARRSLQSRSRGYLDPSWSLVLFYLSGIALIVAWAVIDTGRANRRLLQAGEVSYTAEQLRELETEIVVGGWIAVLLCAALVATGILAAAWSRRSRGIAPDGPWPVAMRFPDDDDPDASRSSSPADGDRPVMSSPVLRVPTSRFTLDSPGLVIPGSGGLFSAAGTLLAAISHREVTWTEIDVYTFWSARGVAAFSVQVQLPLAGGNALSAGARWRLTSWTSPLADHVEVVEPSAAELVLHASGEVKRRLIPCPSIREGRRYLLVDEHDRTVATLERSGRGWTCEMSTELSPVMRRLLCVAPLWAERRYGVLKPSD